MIRLLAVALALFVGGCGSAGSVTVSRPPAWEYPADRTVMTSLSTALRANEIIPGVPVQFSDDAYTKVNRVWLDKYIAWTWAAAKADGIRYTPESFDCEDFALAFYLFATLSAAHAGEHAAPLIARVVVQYDPTHLHELIGVVTDQGCVIVEPQPDAGPFRVTPLDQYSKPILRIKFGD